MNHRTEDMTAEVTEYDTLGAAAKYTVDLIEITVCAVLREEITMEQGVEYLSKKGFGGEATMWLARGFAALAEKHCGTPAPEFLKIKTSTEINSKKHLLIVLRDRSIMALARRLYSDGDLVEKEFKDELKYADLQHVDRDYLQNMYWPTLKQAMVQVLDEPEERRRMLSLDDSDVQEIYSSMKDADCGYAIGAKKDSPSAAALGAGYQVLRTTSDGIVVCLDAEGDGALVADVYGPWAVPGT